MALQSCKGVALGIKQKSGHAKRLLEIKSMGVKQMGDIIVEILHNVKVKRPSNGKQERNDGNVKRINLKETKNHLISVPEEMEERKLSNK